MKFSKYLCQREKVNYFFKFQLILAGTFALGTSNLGMHSYCDDGEIVRPIVSDYFSREPKIRL